MKELIRSICPPIIWRALVGLRWKIKVKQMKPTDFKVRSGPLVGGNLFINDIMPLFQSMHQGDYDSFFWEYLAKENLANATILEVGGHIGYHALCFARMVGEGGKVFVFEPNPYNRERFKINVDKNPELKSRINLLANAVGRDQCEMEFCFSENVDDETSSGGFLVGSERSTTVRAYSKFSKQLVECIKLDEFVRQNDLSRICVVKIDVEGAEGFVLDGSLEMIMKHRPILMIEIHSVEAMNHVYHALDRVGYFAEILSVDHESRCFVGCKPRCKV